MAVVIDGFHFLDITLAELFCLIRHHEVPLRLGRGIRVDVTSVEEGLPEVGTYVLEVRHGLTAQWSVNTASIESFWSPCLRLDFDTVLIDG